MNFSVKKISSKWTSLPVEAKASTAYAICVIALKCISLITLPLFTRLLTEEQYGQTTVYSSWSGIFTTLLTLNLAYGSFSTAMMKFEHDRDGYISSVHGICITLSGIFLLIYLPFRSSFNKLLGLPTPIVVLMISELLALNAFNLWSGKKKFEYKYKPVVAFTVCMTVFGVALAVIAVLMNTEKGYARIVGFASVNILLGGALLIAALVQGKKIFNAAYWKYALGFNLPLLAYYLSQTIFNQSDRIMIDHYCGKDKAAIYGVAYNLSMLMIFVLNAINNSYVPWFYKKIKEGKEEENAKVSLGIAALMAGLIMIVVIMAPEIIMIMAGKAYAEAVWIIPPVAISLLLLFYSQLFINVEFYYEQKRKLVYASVTAAAANIVLNAILIPRVSYIAAGYTTMLSYIIFAYSNYLTMRTVAKENNFSLKALNMKHLTALFIVFCLLCFGFMALYKLIIIRYLIVVSMMVAAFIKRKQLIGFINNTVRMK